MQIATAMLLCGGHCLDAETFEDVQGVLGRYCIDCHSGSDAESGIAIGLIHGNECSQYRSSKLEKNPSSGAR